jgi:hypothetical protein
MILHIETKAQDVARIKQLKNSKDKWEKLFKCQNLGK